jgi:hypothetical protein
LHAPSNYRMLEVCAHNLLMHIEKRTFFGNVFLLKISSLIMVRPVPSNVAYTYLNRSNILDELVAQNIESLKAVDVLQFFDEYIDPRSRTRRKLSVHLRSAKHAPPVTPSVNLRAFRSSLFPKNCGRDSDECLTVEY